jgi:DNA-binding NarL/FixJ family response regulator
MADGKPAGRIDAVLIADDHEVFRFGLSSLLRHSLGVATIVEAESFEAALARLEDPRIGLAIFDLGMPGLGGPRDLAEVRVRRPEVRVVVLSASDAREDILEALEAGVHGYIVKSERTDPLIERLRYVLSGEIYVPPALAERPARPVEKVEVRKAGALPLETLSDRQRQVLKGVVEGMSNKEIARSLALSEGTVKMHLAALFRALGASNRAHAAALGKQMLG